MSGEGDALITMFGEGGLSSCVVQDCFAGTIVHPPGKTYGPRLQLELQLVLLHTGSMRIDVDGDIFVCPPGHVVFLKPGHRLFIAFAEHEDTWHRWISLIVRDMGEDAKHELKQLPHMLPISEQMNRLVDLAVGIHRHNSLEHTPVLRTLGLAAIQLFIAESLRGVPSTIHPAVSSVKSLIQERFHERLALADLAAGSGVTPGHLNKLFQRYEAATPMQYLWRFRLQRGLEQLRRSGLSVGEVAERCGFQSSHHFSRTIKSCTGLTPTEIRDNCWRNDAGAASPFPVSSMKEDKGHVNIDPRTV